MRPLYLLALKIDESHKQYIKDYHGSEKNFKICKQYEVYSWSKPESGLRDSRVPPELLAFSKENEAKEMQVAEMESIKDIRTSDSFTAALNEEGQVYTWGSGINGRLGHNNFQVQAQPKLVKFDFKGEDKKIKQQKNKQQNLGGLEDLITFHRFVRNSNQKQAYLNKKRQVETEILGHAFSTHFTGDCDDDFSPGLKGSKLLKKTFNAAGEIVRSQEDQINFLDIQLQLSKLTKTAVNRIACSSRHTLAVTNTGAVFSWGENDHFQLGYATTKKNKGITYEAKPRKVESLAKEFVIDVACGEHHSVALTNDKNALMWGSNKQSQLGFDSEIFPLVQTPKKLIHHEYQNSANKECFQQIFAAGFYTVLVGFSSKLVYISDKHSGGTFMPVFGKTPGSFHYRKVDGTQGAWLARDYLLVMDSFKTIYRQDLEAKKSQQHQNDKVIAIEFLKNSPFIELFPSEKDIWALNSMRQLFVCQDFKQNLNKSGSVTFEPVNHISNVMTAAVSKKQIFAIKIVKLLDEELMTRKISSSFDPDLALTDILVKQATRALTLNTCLDKLFFADHIQNEELKINCLKFVMFNIVNFFLEGSETCDQMLSMPLYLVRDIANFIKLPTTEKFLWLDMAYFDCIHEYDAVNVFRDEEISAAFCKEQFSQLTNMYMDYQDGQRQDQQLRAKIAETARQLKQIIRKENKRRRKSSQIDSTLLDADEGTTVMNPESSVSEVGEYLELINEFIKTNLSQDV